MMDPYYRDPWLSLYQGHALDVLRQMPSESVHMAITSPPYYGLRDYDVSPVVWDGDPDCPHEWDESFCSLCNAWLGQLGLEPTPDLYVDHLVQIFRELRRVLRHDGTFWLNLGDSYASYRDQKEPAQTIDKGNLRGRTTEDGTAVNRNANALRSIGIKHKDMIGVPWMAAFAMRRDGWYLRSDVIWAKPNVMPESVSDRPTKAHEYLFLFSKSERYFYDSFAIKEPIVEATQRRLDNQPIQDRDYQHDEATRMGKRSANRVWSDDDAMERMREGRNKRTVWFVASAPYPGAHYAPFPPKLIEPPILAGTSENGVCPTCGAPSRRVVETERAYDHVTTDIGKQADGPYVTQVGGGEDGHDVRHGVVSIARDVGWSEPCSHGHPLIPATILDPFGGSGTAGMVAQKLSRRAILIDLNADYLKQQLIRNMNLPLGL